MLRYAQHDRMQDGRDAAGGDSRMAGMQGGRVATGGDSRMTELQDGIAGWPGCGKMGLQLKKQDCRIAVCRMKGLQLKKKRCIGVLVGPAGLSVMALIDN